VDAIVRIFVFTTVHGAYQSCKCSYYLREAEDINGDNPKQYH